MPRTAPENLNQRILQWVSAGLLILGAVVIVFFFPDAQSNQAPQDRYFEINASRFSYAPGELHVNPGDRVTIKLVTTDVVHGFSLDNHNFELSADPGQPVTGTFVAGAPGVYRFRCSVTCGNLHPFMMGKLSVGSNTLVYKGLALLGLSLLAIFLFPRQRPVKEIP